MEQGSLVLQIKKGSKRFPGTLAVDEVDFDVYCGELHAIVGENGAGKSTLMKMITGLYNDYTGQIFINGKEVKLHSPLIAKKNGIGMLYQELSLAKPLSIAENILVGRLPIKNKFILDKKAVIDKTEACLKRVGLNLNPFTTIEEISQHEAQLIELAKVLGNNPSILVMYEPTSALSREEVERLFGIIKNLKKQGLAIIYISHHLSEIFRVADRITVMRDGKKIGTKQGSDVTTEELAEMMVGRSVKKYYTEYKTTPDKEKLRIERLSRYGFFHNISLYVRAGEILGICGLSGAGRTELARSICGIDPIDEGKIYLNGERIHPKSMDKAMKYGLGYLTEDRKAQGLFLRLSVGENILSALIPGLGWKFIYSKRRGSNVLKSLIDKLKIHPPIPSINLNNLSGGNQQKVLLAKWLAIEPQVIFFDEPTRGVDIGAKIIIHKAILKLAKRGSAIVLITSDLPELVGLSDRVMIMRKGHFIHEMIKEDCTEESVLLAANGERENINA